MGININIITIIIIISYYNIIRIILLNNRGQRPTIWIIL